MQTTIRLTRTIKKRVSILAGINVIIFGFLYDVTNEVSLKLFYMTNVIIWGIPFIVLSELVFQPNNNNRAYNVTLANIITIVFIGLAYGCHLHNKPIILPGVIATLSLMYSIFGTYRNLCNQRC